MNLNTCDGIHHSCHSSDSIAKCLLYLAWCHMLLCFMTSESTESRVVFFLELY